MSKPVEDLCGKIKAYFRREERYEGLQLVFKEHPELKDRIVEAIEKTIEETGANPAIYENSEKVGATPYAFYIEFNDDYDKDGGNFFEILMRRLGIDKCEQ